MSTTWRRLYQGRPTTETTLYTAPDNVVVREILVCNTAATAGTVSLALVPAGGTADGTHRIIGGATVAANDTLVFDVVQPLAIGDFLSAIVSATTMVVTISGIGGL